MGWWTTVSTLVVLGIVGVIVSRGATSSGDIVHTVTAPEIGSATKISVVKVATEAFDRVEEGDVILEVKAGTTTKKVEAPADGIVTGLAAAVGQEVAVGADLVTIQTGPNIGDHWHSAYGVNVCGTWLPQIGEFESDFHSHGDGLIHAHPRSSSAAGSNADLRLFFDRAGFELTATKLEYSDGKTYESGDVECGEGKDKEEAVLRWAVNGKEQEGNPANFVVGNGDVVAIGFLPEDAEFDTVPPSTAHMAENYVPPKHPDFQAPETSTPPSAPPGGAPTGG